MSKILVTGATGFVGSHLVEALVNRGEDVHCLVRSNSNLRWLKKLPINLIKGDCTNFSSLKSLPSDVEFVFHLAGLIKAKKKTAFYQVNYQGTVNLIKICLIKRWSLKRFIFVSTLAVHGSPSNSVIRSSDMPNPLTHYAKSKWLAEQALLKVRNKLHVIIFRPTAVYGPRDRELLGYYRLIKMGWAPILNPSARLSLCYILDLIQALIKALKANVPFGSTFLISDGRAYTWSGVVKTVASLLGTSPHFIYFPKRLTSIVAIAAEAVAKISRQPIMFSRDKLKEILQNTWICDISNSIYNLAYQPSYSLKNGMAETISWYKAQGWL